MIEIFEDAHTVELLSSSCDFLEISNCKIQYLITNASKVILHNISELNLIVSHNPGITSFDFQNVHIKYRSDIIQKYAFWKNDRFELFQSLYPDYYKSKPFDSIRSKYCMYLRKPTGIDSVDCFFIKQDVYDHFSNNTTLSSTTVSSNKKDQKQFLINQLKAARNRYVLTNKFVIRSFINTLKELSKEPGIHSEESDLLRYYYYFKSRGTFLGHILFWINEGYFNILRPLCILLVCLSIFTFIIKNDYSSSTIMYLFSPVKLLTEVVFSSVPKDFIRIIICLLKRLLLTSSYMSIIYSSWSILIALNRRYGFPKNITDNPS